MEEISELINRIELHCNDIINISKSIKVNHPNEENLKTLKILIATDGSKNADWAVDYALNMAIQTHAEILLLHVVKESTERAMGVNLVNEKAMRIRNYGIDVSSRIECGNPVNKILTVADESDAGMIVLGLNGMSSWKGALMGNVSEKVLDRASVPVLVIR